MVTSKRSKKLLLSIIGISVFLTVYYAFLYFAQDRLLFMPNTISGDDLNKVRSLYPNAEEIQIKTPDNLYLHGWFVKKPGPDRAPLLIFFGGNGDEMSSFLKDAMRFKGWSVALVNYRGYGLSQGRPSEENLFRDALVIYDYLISRKDVDTVNVMVMGRSLGTGVAVYLASQRPLKGVILVSPYDSVNRVAKAKFPLAPVSLLLKHPFDSIDRAPSIAVPLLALAATGDRVIPPRHSRQLVDSWGGPNTLQMIAGADHNTIFFSPEYWEGITAFLNRIIQEGNPL